MAIVFQFYPAWGLQLFEEQMFWCKLRNKVIFLAAYHLHSNLSLKGMNKLQIKDSCWWKEPGVGKEKQMEGACSLLALCSATLCSTGSSAQGPFTSLICSSSPAKPLENSETRSKRQAKLISWKRQHMHERLPSSPMNRGIFTASFGASQDRPGPLFHTSHYRTPLRALSPGTCTVGRATSEDDRVKRQGFLA